MLSIGVVATFDFNFAAETVRSLEATEMLPPFVAADSDSCEAAVRIPDDADAANADGPPPLLPPTTLL